MGAGLARVAKRRTPQPSPHAGYGTLCGGKHADAIAHSIAEPTAVAAMAIGLVTNADGFSECTFLDIARQLAEPERARRSMEASAQLVRDA